MYNMTLSNNLNEILKYINFHIYLIYKSTSLCILALINNIFIISINLIAEFIFFRVISNSFCNKIV